jgi:leader peptidase (prepilin peptidase)/N-methyltransferase
VGGGALWGIGWLGKRVYSRDAMGFGDVKLLAAGGGFVGPGGAMMALLIGALVASVVGLANMLRFLCLTRRRARRRGARQRFGRALLVARVAGRYLPFGPYLGLGIGIALLDWNDVVRLWSGFVP